MINKYFFVLNAYLVYLFTVKLPNLMRSFDSILLRKFGQTKSNFLALLSFFKILDDSVRSNRTSYLLELTIRSNVFQSERGSSKLEFGSVEANREKF